MMNLLALINYRMLTLIITINAVVLILLIACSEAPRGTGGINDFYAFNPAELTDPTIHYYSLQKISRDIQDAPKLQGIETLSITEESLLRFVISILAERKINSPNFQLISYRSSCKHPTNPENIFYRFVLPSDEIPGFPYIHGWAEVWVEQGRVQLMSVHQQKGSLGLDDPKLTYPTPISYQNALSIAEENGSQQAVEKLGSQCEFQAILNSKTWKIGWHSKQSPNDQALFGITIDAMTGEVISTQWVDKPQ